MAVTKNAETLSAGITHAHDAVMVSNGDILREEDRQDRGIWCSVNFGKQLSAILTPVRYCS